MMCLSCLVSVCNLFFYPPGPIRLAQGLFDFALKASRASLVRSCTNPNRHIQLLCSRSASCTRMDHVPRCLLGHGQSIAPWRSQSFVPGLVCCVASPLHFVLFCVHRPCPFSFRQCPLYSVVRPSSCVGCLVSCVCYPPQAMALQSVSSFGHVS